MNKRSRRPVWIVYLLWAVFVNVCNVFLIQSAVEDYTILGVLGTVGIVVLWLFGIRGESRRRWIVFTVFSLLLGSGLSSIATYPLLVRVTLTLIMVLGLFVLAWGVGRVRWTNLGLTAIVLVLVNEWIPISEWPFFTHFRVASFGIVNLNSSDLPAVPFQVISTPSGSAVVMLSEAKETITELQNVAINATGSPSALQDVLRDYQHRYEFDELVYANGHFERKPLPNTLLPEVNPNQFITTFFPFISAHWTTEGGRVVQYMAPTKSPQLLTQMTSAAGDLPANLQALANGTQADEVTEWNQLLAKLGLSRANTGLSIAHGVLSGTYNGRQIDVPVLADSIVGAGSFTQPGAHQVLLQGVGTLQVVSLDDGMGRVVSTYKESVSNPLPSDIVIGPLDNSGQDVVFVNSVPAEILRVNAGGDWQTIYKAPSGSFRFEASVRFAGDPNPEIITDDPSYMSSAPQRYFTSYTYRNGQLIRNWRVYRTNLVNVHPVQFSNGGPTYLVAAIYGTGKYVILSRHYWPVVPATSALLGVILVGSIVLRLTRRGVKRDDI